ncbi:hypothetical protein ILUMI_17242, partial [Ignelater luminosus]
ILPMVGQCELTCEHNNNKYNVKFFIVNDLTEALLGLKTCMELHLTRKNDDRLRGSPATPINSITDGNIKSEYTKNQIKQSHGEVFAGIGCINPPYHIQLVENAQPTISPIRKVPVDGPSDWVNPLVLVKKSDDSLRICLDPLNLNKAIKREHCKLLTLDEITSKLKDARIFSKLDVNQAFYQIPLDEASSNLCTVRTPLGRYKFLRLPYAVYIDDIIVWGKSKAEHDITLEAVLETARKNNVKFNLSKCTFVVSELKFMGHTISDQGVAIDRDRLQGIIEFPEPKCKKDVQRLLGVVNYVSKYVPNFSEGTKPLRELLKKDTFFSWEEHHKAAFTKLKNSL